MSSGVVWAASALPGSDIGLAIVRRIVEDHGGAIDADSRPGEGTTVTVMLPRVAVHKEATASPAPLGARAS